jgi:hypothetical protein
MQRWESKGNGYLRRRVLNIEESFIHWPSFQARLSPHYGNCTERSLSIKTEYCKCRKQNKNLNEFMCHGMEMCRIGFIRTVRAHQVMHQRCSLEALVVLHPLLKKENFVRYLKIRFMGSPRTYGTNEEDLSVWR